MPNKLETLEENAHPTPKNEEHISVSLIEVFDNDTYQKIQFRSNRAIK